MDAQWLRIAVELGIGLFAGVLSGLMGIGGGVVLVPAMTFLPSGVSATRLPPPTHRFHETSPLLLAM